MRRIRYERAHVYQTEHATRVVLDQNTKPFLSIFWFPHSYQFNLPLDLEPGFHSFEHDGMQGFVAVYEWDPKVPRLKAQFTFWAFLNSDREEILLLAPARVVTGWFVATDSWD